jgi:hypothetical protein
MESDSENDDHYESDGFGGADPHVKVCRTAAGPAQLHGSLSGENCSTVGSDSASQHAPKNCGFGSGIAGLWRRYIKFLPSP